MLANRDTNINKNKSLQELTTVYFENFLITCISLKTHEQKGYFGSFIDGRFVEKLESKIVFKTWQEIPSVFQNCSLGSFGVSPDEFTGILKFDAKLSDDSSFKYLPSVIGRFKARSTKLINQLHITPSKIFWKNGYTIKPIENLNDLSDALNKINSHK